MWVWEVDDELEPIIFFIIKPSDLLLRYATYYHAMLIDVDWV